MRTSSTRRYEPRSPFSATSALEAGKHTSGRRSVRSFALEYRLERLQAHTIWLANEYNRARQLRRPEKMVKLMGMQANTLMAIQAMTKELAERAAKRTLAKTKDGGRVLLDLTHVSHAVWGKKAPRWGQEIVNAGKVIRLVD